MGYLFGLLCIISIDYVTQNVNEAKFNSFDIVTFDRANFLTYLSSN